MRPIVRVENLGKQYKIGAPRSPHGSLRDALTGVFRSPLKSLRRASGSKEETMWALQDVSFEVEPGEVVGIIGRNGAGKSTLLKLLSRITEPSTGRIELYGRVASLLEVGTGFNPELTGRENIYLNGAILGMSRAEIRRNFEEIVDFSEVERFIDTPVKHYSSGMYMRLAFAIAAHLEPEILIVDEVLSVGDASFQKKCLNKMEDVGQEGRTVLFVSHDVSAVTRLCPRSILLDGGKVSRDGPSEEVVGAYLGSDKGTTAEREWPNLDEAPGSEVARLRAVRVCDEDGRVADVADIRRPVALEVEYQVLRSVSMLTPVFRLYNEEGNCVFTTRDPDPAWRGRPRSKGNYVSTAMIPGNLLAEGTLFVSVALATAASPVVVHYHERDAVAFQVVDSFEGDSARGDFTAPIPGVVRPLLKWNTRFDETLSGSSELTGERSVPRK